MLMRTLNLTPGDTFILQPEDFYQVKEHPRNTDLYDPKVDYAEDNQDYQGLKKDIKEEFNKNKEHGNLEPITISKNGYILSGHRRFNAARALGIPLKFIVSSEIVDFKKNISEQYNQLRSFNKSKTFQRKEGTYESVFYRANNVYLAAIKDGYSEKEARIKEKDIHMEQNIDSPQYAKVNKIMQMGRIDLLKKVDAGQETLHKAWSLAKEVS